MCVYISVYANIHVLSIIYSSVMYFYGPPHMAKQKRDDQLKHTYSSYVRIRDVALKTYQKRWMIGRSGEKGSGISVRVTRHDDDDLLFKTWCDLLYISEFTALILAGDMVALLTPFGHPAKDSQGLQHCTWNIILYFSWHFLLTK